MILMKVSLSQVILELDSDELLILFRLKKKQVHSNSNNHSSSEVDN